MRLLFPMRARPPSVRSGGRRSAPPIGGPACCTGAAPGRNRSQVPANSGMVVVDMRRRDGMEGLPGWVAAVVTAAFVASWYLATPFLREVAVVPRAVAAFLMVGLLGTVARYLVQRHPVVFIQDILIELGIYVVAGAACGEGLSYVTYRWGVTVSPAWPALAAYLALTFWFDRRTR